MSDVVKLEFYFSSNPISLSNKWRAPFFHFRNIVAYKLLCKFRIIGCSPPKRLSKRPEVLKLPASKLIGNLRRNGSPFTLRRIP